MRCRRKYWLSGRPEPKNLPENQRIVRRAESDGCIELRTSMPTLEVRPLSISCLCLNKLTLARPLPSSSCPVDNVHEETSSQTIQKDIPLVRTPNVVDLPLSTFPTTAHRTSGVVATSGGGNRSSNAALGWSDLLSNNIDVFWESTRR